MVSSAALTKLKDIAKNDGRSLAKNQLLLVVRAGSLYLCSARRFDLRLKLSDASVRSSGDACYLVSSVLCDALSQNPKNIILNTEQDSSAVHLLCVYDHDMLTAVAQTRSFELIDPDPNLIAEPDAEDQSDQTFIFTTGTGFSEAIASLSLSNNDAHSRAFLALEGSCLKLQKHGETYAAYETEIDTCHEAGQWAREFSRSDLNALTVILKKVSELLSITFQHEHLILRTDRIEIRIPAVSKTASVFLRDIADELAEFEQLTGIYPLSVSDLADSLKQSLPGEPVTIRMPDHQMGSMLFSAFTVDHKVLIKALMQAKELRCWLRSADSHQPELVFFRRVMPGIQALHKIPVEGV